MIKQNDKTKATKSGCLGDSSTIKRWYDPWIMVLLFVTLLLCLLVYCFELLVTPMNYDDHAHIHYLWLVSIGKKPWVDFMCHYPSLGYYLLAPLFSWFPPNELTMHLTRLVTMGSLAAIAGMSAFHSKKVAGNWFPGLLTIASSAILINVGFFREFRTDILAYVFAVSSVLILLYSSNSLSKLFYAGCLAVFSLGIMPKHVFIMAGVIAGYVFFSFMTKDDPWKRMLTLLGSLIFTVLICSVITRWTFFSIYYVMTMAGGADAVTFQSFGLLSAMLNVVKSPGILILCFGLTGVVMFGLRARYIRRKEVYLMGGLLAGLLGTLLVVNNPYSQYTALPVIFMLFFVPYMYANKYRRFLLVLTCCCIVTYITVIAGDLHKLTKSTDVYQKIELHRLILSIVPEYEYVVSCPFTHPNFRLNPGFVYYDNKPSYRANLPQKFQKYFTVDYFLDRLYETKPAYFCFFTMDNQPPEYVEACRRFFAQQQEDYATVNLPCSTQVHGLLRDNVLPVILRKDLLK